MYAVLWALVPLFGVGPSKKIMAEEKLVNKKQTNKQTNKYQPMHGDLPDSAVSLCCAKKKWPEQTQ